MPQSASTTYTNDELQPLWGTGLARKMSVRLKPSTTFPKGCAIGEISATPGVFGPYASGNSDGSQNPACLLDRACVTDANGNITFGTASGGMEYGQTYTNASAFFEGVFATSDLPSSGAGSLDAAGIAKLGRLLKAGVLKLS